MSYFDNDAVPAPAEKPAPVREQFSRRIEVEPRKRQRGTDETVCPITMRVRAAAWNQFVDFAESRRLSYREAFDILVERIG